MNEVPPFPEEYLKAVYGPNSLVWEPAKKSHRIGLIWAGASFSERREWVKAWRKKEQQRQFDLTFVGPRLPSVVERLEALRDRLGGLDGEALDEAIDAYVSGY
jgi:hypothetical protein